MSYKHLLEYDPDRKMVLIDFDGVIHTYKSGWTNENQINDGPLPGAIDWLTGLVQNRFLDVRIFSNRCNSPSGINVMKSWLVYHGFPIGLLENLGFQPGKPKAHVIIDDRARQFHIPPSLAVNPFVRYSEKLIIDFKPWYYDHPDWNRK